MQIEDEHTLINTKSLADMVVDKLSIRLRSVDLPVFRSIYVSGSYCRGDWLNCSSDLDIHTVYNDCQLAYKEENIRQLRAIVDECTEGKSFPSHCPGGIDYGFNYSINIPAVYEEACKPSPYANFSTLMFDFKENHITLYGEELNNLLPKTPDPKESAKDWLNLLADRIKYLSAEDHFHNSHKVAFNSYKAILAAQLIHGEATINKYKILELYQKYVPDFSMKWFGELVIRNYIGSIYPDRPPVDLDRDQYQLFIDRLLDAETI